ncbi:hypothetical protein Moror_14612 [Moniliophthora roreri MCA 2997]|uniref:Uncharacterized protein n=1 Tax=Moniliophthora roreri (strain MCA 2997) TaxID=1381753 RepID=V2XHP3_MONRO|nr:hypothetical protein Moror_14612 [Moniliophthora roreri MCA 2997]
MNRTTFEYASCKHVLRCSQVLLSYPFSKYPAPLRSSTAMTRAEKAFRQTITIGAWSAIINRKISNHNICVDDLEPLNAEPLPTLVSSLEDIRSELILILTPLEDPADVQCLIPKPNTHNGRTEGDWDSSLFLKSCLAEHLAQEGARCYTDTSRCVSEIPQSQTVHVRSPAQPTFGRSSHRSRGTLKAFIVRNAVRLYPTLQLRLIGL